MKTKEIRLKPESRNQVKGILAHYYTRRPQVLVEVLETALYITAAEYNEGLLKKEAQIIETLIERYLEN